MARFVVLVIDSFGVGAMKDVTLVRPQDAGANTCGHILSQLPHLQLPTLEKLGLINALGYAPGDMQPSDSATWGVAELQHEGGDTFMGHQGILRGTRPLPPLRMPFRDVIDRVERHQFPLAGRWSAVAMICNFCGSIRRLRLAIISRRI